MQLLGPTRWERGRVPAGLAGARHRSPLVQAERDQAVFSLGSVGRFLVRPGRPVVVEAAPGATEADIECMLAGPVAALQCCLEGVPCLRGAAVEMSGRGVLIVGGARGTSALAAALACRGAKVVADSVLCTGGGPLSVWPAPGNPSGRLALWPDVARAIGLDPAQGVPVRPALGLRQFALGPGATAPVPISAAVMTTVDSALGGDRPSVDREAMSQLEAVRALLDASWHSPVVGDLGRRRDEFEHLTQLAATVPMWRLRRAGTTVAGTLEELARQTEEALG